MADLQRSTSNLTILLAPSECYAILRVTIHRVELLSCPSAHEREVQAGCTGNQALLLPQRMCLGSRSGVGPEEEAPFCNPSAERGDFV